MYCMFKQREKNAESENSNFLRADFIKYSKRTNKNFLKRGDKNSPPFHTEHKGQP